MFPLWAGGGMGMFPHWAGGIGGGTGAVMLMESCEPREECDWEEVREAEELCKLGRRWCTCGEEGMFQFYNHNNNNHVC